MEAYICTACGTQYAPGDKPPAQCAICEEERQYVPASGQSWTTLKSLAASRFNSYREHEPGLIGIGTQPAFAIGQRALLIRTPDGNVLWDCISMLDDATVSLIKGLGGLQAMAISHPHFYTSMNDWADAFDVDVHVHAGDQEHIVRKGPRIKLWEGETLKLTEDTTLIRGGGHFEGSSMLHWAGGANGRGIVCSSDTAYVAADRRQVSFMRSYPNFLPLPGERVQAIANALAPFDFDKMFGNFFESVIESGAKQAFERSVTRYLAAIGSR